MKGLISTIFLLLLNLWSFALDKNDTIACYVNEDVITKNDVNELSKEAGLDYTKALNQLIEQHILLQDFKDKKGKIPAAQLDAQMDSIVQESFNGNRNALSQVLKMKGQSFFGLKEEIKTSIILNVMRHQKSQSIGSISLKKIREYYQQHTNDFKLPARYYIEQSGFKETSKLSRDDVEKSKVDVLKNELLGKFSIEEIKKQLDEFTVAPIWYNASELDPTLLKCLEHAKIGHVTDYLKINDVWVTSKLLDKESERVKPLSEVQSEIEEKILIEINQKNYQDYIDFLKKKSVIRILP